MVNHWETVAAAYNITNKRDCLVCVCPLSCPIMSDSVTPWTAAHQSPLSTEFSRQEFWSGLPFHIPGDLPHPGIEPMSLAFPA